MQNMKISDDRLRSFKVKLLIKTPIFPDKWSNTKEEYRSMRTEFKPLPNKMSGSPVLASRSNRISRETS